MRMQESILHRGRSRNIEGDWRIAIARSLDSCLRLKGLPQIEKTEEGTGEVPVSGGHQFLWTCGAVLH